MIARSDSAESRASQEATDWLILLQDDPEDPDLCRRFDAWLDSDPVNAEAWSVTQRTARVLAKIPPKHIDRWGPVVANPVGEERDALLQKGWWTGALHGKGRKIGLGFAVVVACLAYIGAPAMMIHLRADYITGVAQIRTITVTGGSTVTLAPDSAISVAYNTRGQTVNLLAGEAFFAIKHHNADRPFRVVVGGIEITDIGTSFDIRHNDDGASIAVLQGSLQVNCRAFSPPVSVTLAARHTLRVAWTGAVVQGNEPPEQIAAWRQGRLVAQDKPMREVVDRLRPYFAGMIVITNSALSSRPVTGVYNLADPVEALRGIAQAHGASVHQISPWILMVSGG
jgi:transmembrane sensor